MSDHPHLTSMPEAGMDRRQFIMLLSAAAAAYPLSALAEKRRQPAAIDYAALQEPWLTIDAVQQHLFPAEKDAPGARDINALPYLQAMLQSPGADPEHVDFMKQGVVWLNDIARKQKQAGFIKLDVQDKEQVLRDIEKSRAGERWLSRHLSYILEALVTDPVYGGNPDGVGWQWLQHQPGFPSPPSDKVFYRLPTRTTFRRTRA